MRCERGTKKNHVMKEEKQIIELVGGLGLLFTNSHGSKSGTDTIFCAQQKSSEKIEMNHFSLYASWSALDCTATAYICHTHAIENTI